MSKVHRKITGYRAIHEIMFVGNVDPTTVPANDVQPNVFWLDTTAGDSLETGAILNQRNAGNTAWTARATLGTAAALASDTDGALAANSDLRLATQKAVKTYIDSIITGGASDVMIFKGVIDCSANPNYPAADAGNVYKVSVAGKIGGASGPNVEVGDTLYCITDGTVSGNHATVGANWVIVQENIDGAVIGPTSVTDSRIALFDGTTGKLIKDGGSLLTDLVAKTLLTTKGDLIVATGANTPARLGVGTNGNLLVADSGQSAGVKWQRGIAAGVTTLVDGATITWDFAGYYEMLAEVNPIGGNRTLAFANIVAGCRGTLIIHQDGTGSRTLTLPAGSKVRDSGAGAITLSTAANSIDVLSFIYDGTNYLWTYGKSFT